MTFGSRSSPAIATAGSPGRSCCSPKISTDTKKSVGMIAARRLMRKFVMVVAPAKAGAQSHLQALHADEPVGNRAQPRELGGVGPQPGAVEEINDGPVLRLHRGHLVEELDALARV